MARTYVERMGLEFEAERLVRCGESRAEASRILGVSQQTLAGWALRGGWRKKDIDAQNGAEMTRRTIQRIRSGGQAKDAERAMEAERIALMRECVELIAEGAEDMEEALMRLLSATSKRLPAPAAEGEPFVDPKVRGMGGLGEAGGHSNPAHPDESRNPGPDAQASVDVTLGPDFRRDERNNWDEPGEWGWGPDD